ncbi:hypothetical protein BCY86_06305 [Pajaroellobacter abortibovis]|uniref:Uncharacterized protein n=1 Tax=Pajaroellobacter abortibovis TaxID=1882918 RepID=A0A1L6MXL6_9BACT|nr:hypothetical protein BCY86_06305 [Pajaroellobacter abortibovis]
MLEQYNPTTPWTYQSIAIAKDWVPQLTGAGGRYFGFPHTGILDIQMKRSILQSELKHERYFKGEAQKIFDLQNYLL